MPDVHSRSLSPGSARAVDARERSDDLKMPFGFGFFGKNSKILFLAKVFSMFAHTLIPKTNFPLTLITIKIVRRSVCFFV